jgi:hypothetical protein
MEGTKLSMLVEIFLWIDLGLSLQFGCSAEWFLACFCIKNSCVGIVPYDTDSFMLFLLYFTLPSYLRGKYHDNREASFLVRPNINPQWDDTLSIPAQPPQHSGPIRKTTSDRSPQLPPTS